MTGVIIALVSGILMSVQGVFNTQVTNRQACGYRQDGCSSQRFWSVLGHGLPKQVGVVTALFQVTPRYVLLGGVIGAAITITVIQSMNSLGPAQSAMLIVIAQLIAAWLIELFGWFGMEKTSFEWRKFIGMLVAIAGIILFKWEK